MVLRQYRSISMPNILNFIVVSCIALLELQYTDKWCLGNVIRIENEIYFIGLERYKKFYRMEKRHFQLVLF